MNIKTNLSKKENYGGERSTDSIKYIVVHYTGNDGDTDENNGKYFGNNVVGVSAHYFVDDDSVTQSVPDNFVAWHCGGATYKHKKCRNSNSIGVEICDDVKNGTIYPSEKTIANALELVEWLMKKYSVPKANVIRHYDVTGKLCPAYWCGTVEKDAKWETAFWNRLGGSGGTSGSGNNPAPTNPEKVLYRVQVGAYTMKKNAEMQLARIKAAGFSDAFIAVVDNGSLYRVQVGAFAEKTNAEAQLTKVKAAGFNGYVTKLGGQVLSENPKKEIAVGCLVRVKTGAKDYNGGGMADFVYERNHRVKSINGNRVVITYNDVVVAAVHKDNLILL